MWLGQRNAAGPVLPPRVGVQVKARVVGCARAARSRWAERSLSHGAPILAFLCPASPGCCRTDTLLDVYGVYKVETIGGGSGAGGEGGVSSNSVGVTVAFGSNPSHTESTRSSHLAPNVTLRLTTQSGGTGSCTPVAQQLGHQGCGLLREMDHHRPVQSGSSSGMRVRLALGFRTPPPHRWKFVRLTQWRPACASAPVERRLLHAGGRAHGAGRGRLHVGPRARQRGRAARRQSHGVRQGEAERLACFIRSVYGIVQSAAEGFQWNTSKCQGSLPCQALSYCHTAVAGPSAERPVSPRAGLSHDATPVVHSRNLS